MRLPWLADKLYFLCELSWEMLSTDQMSLNYRQFPERIRRLFGAIVQQEKDLDHWHFDMMGQTMLIRNADGDYTPAHRSLLEFFVAHKFAAELGVLAEDFIELARSQSHINSDAPQEYTWSSYFSRNMDMLGNILPSASLSEFVGEPLEKLKETFGLKLLTKAVIDLLVPMLSSNKSLINIIEKMRFKSEDEVGYIGGNAVTLLLKQDKLALGRKDFSYTVIKGADFTNASLLSTNFTGANLAQSNFIKCLDMVCSVKFSPDNKLYATGEACGEVRIWRVADDKQIVVCKGHSSWVNSIAFS
jgi:predicted NACHT family NTPase